jgi:maleylacetoacetate isomerase
MPTQKVPAFVTKEGKILSQTSAIMEYLEEAYPGKVLPLVICAITKNEIERPMLPKSLYDRAVVSLQVESKQKKSQHSL